MFAVTTPTGHVGFRVVQLLLQAGVRPRVLLRDPGRLGGAVRGLVEVCTGDLTDGAYLCDALAGVRSLFLVDPTPHTAADPVGDSDRFGATVADAVRACGVDRVVFVSGVGAERRHGAGHIDGLARIEQHLDATGAAVCHLRCGYFFTNLLMDADAIAANPRGVGDVAVARLLSPAWSGRVVQAVHGPEDLTWRRVAEILTDVLGRPVRVEAVTDDDVRTVLTSAGLPLGAVEGIVGMTAGTRRLVPEQLRDVLTTTPTTLASWAYTHRAALGA